MKDREIEKNRLDLAYQRKSQQMNVVLVFATTGIITMLASFVWYPNRWFIGSVFSTTILIISYFWYKKIDADLKGISEEISKLKR